MGTVNNTEATQLSAREKDAVRTLPWRSLSTKAAFCERYYLVWRGPGEPRATCCQLTGNTSGTPDILLRSEWHEKKRKLPEQPPCFCRWRRNVLFCAVPWHFFYGLECWDGFG